MTALKLLDRTFPTPAEDLAADEALLDACEEGAADAGVLRFYEPTQTCVVVGYGNSIAREVEGAACARAGVPVLRRISGGGTVLLGPGCLAYSLVLPIASNTELETVGGTNRFVMERNRAALESLLGRPVSVRGHTDLAVGDRKFSGNAQRRRRRALLFHGTLLLEADLGLLPRLLPMPSQEPDYRGGRGHLDFVTNLGKPAREVKEVLARAWNAWEPWTEPLGDRMTLLLGEKYASAGWHGRL